MDERNLSGEVRKTVCEILAGLAPRGTQGLIEGICKNVLGVNKEVVYADDKITCITETGWFGRTKAYCKSDREEDNG